MSNKKRRLLLFGEFQLDVDGRMLLRRGQKVALTPKTMELLVLLVENAGELLEKERLMGAIWPDTFVEENNLADNISKLRRVLGEGIIETVPRRGYRFVAEVRGEEDGMPDEAVQGPERQVPPEVDGKISGDRNSWDRWRRFLVTGLLGAILGGGFAGLGVYSFLRGREGATARQLVRPVLSAQLLPPVETSFGQAVLSPDGRWLVFHAYRGANSQLWVRAMGQQEGRPLPGTEGATSPFWSPDGRAIGFFAGGKLKRLDVVSGALQNLCPANSGTGATWNRQGDILFTVLGEPRIYRISEAGGAVTEVLRAQRGQTDLSEPIFLPDGRHFLYLALSSGDPKQAGLHVASLEGEEPRRLMPHDSNVVFVEEMGKGTTQGHLLFGRDGALMAQPFDAGTLQLTGSPMVVAPKLAIVPGGNISYRRRNFTAARELLVYDGNPERLRTQLQWVDRKGQSIRFLSGTDEVSVPALSPDGQNVAVARKDLATNNNDVWILPANGEGATRFTFHPSSDILGIWGPGGSRIAWASSRSGTFDLYEKELDGNGKDRLLLRTELPKFPLDYSADGRYLLFRQIDPKTKHDIYILPLTGEQKPYPYLHSEAMENGGAISPDGRWVAYASDESGRFEIYVESFPSHGGRRQVSLEGGTAPRWRGDGTELYFQASDGPLMVVPIRNIEAMVTGPVRQLFPFRAAGATMIASYAPTHNGQTFLVSAIVEREARAPLTLVQNWLQREGSAR